MRRCSYMTLAGLMLAAPVALAKPAAANLDAVFAGFPDSVCLGDGAGSFSCSDVGTASTGNSGSVALGDVNGDGNLDAIFASRVNPLVGIPADQVCLGDGAGSFSCSDVGTASTESTDVALGDVNGDTNIDAIFATTSNNRACLGDGAGGFTCSEIPDGRFTLGVALGDVNGDNNVDAIFANAFFPPQARSA